MNIENHPCFNPGACRSYGRVHLPVAPRCNIQCNFCNRQFDCVNESRPGVTSGILTPFQAIDYLKKVFVKKGNISVVGIAGPGDPFANPDETLKTLEMVRYQYPDILLCVATNGLNLMPYLDDIKSIDVSHISVTVNAVDPEIGAKVYSWVRFGKKLIGPERGAALLLEQQIEAIKGLKERGIIVKVNTIVLPGINDHHVEDIASTMGRLGVDILNCMPYYPNKGSNLSHLPEPSKEEINAIRKEAVKHIAQMLHCKRCRADAVGLLDDPDDIGLMNQLRACASQEDEIRITPLEKPQSGRKGYVAVTSREGVLVNQHLGEATHLYIYDIYNGNAMLVEKRKAPPPGGRELRWMQMAEVLSDCTTLLVNGIGESPKKILSKGGIEIFEVNGLIDDIVPRVASGSSINHLLKRAKTECKMSCSGTGSGCM
ncbi:MAG: nitrogenase cofactor biosynthesis protein NifB [Desulfamplus sp.]|nr:nitrogenase cofactor biosynthesis protein NifB [Desulfamplus sp.]